MMEPLQSDSIHKLLKDYYSEIDNTLHITEKNGQLGIDSTAVSNIERLFAEDAVYERKGWSAPFKGKHQLSHFLTEDRSIVGIHKVNDGDIMTSQGVDATVYESFHHHFPSLDPSKCITAKASGIYEGAQCNADRTDKKQFVMAYASGITLQFQDIWVFSGDKVVYRYSEIQPLEHGKSTQAQERY